jgi:sigma-54 specific flagellar transcriptional regulator A
VADRIGRFELAHGGTIFLDEIGDMSLDMQVKLLRVLQERVFERVGSALQYRCNVRIIAATHRNLEESIIRGSFREDLFYRLNVFPIDMPPLRSRISDLQVLIDDFALLNVAQGRPRVNFTQPAMTCLADYRWPGNVRELSNLVERLSILCGAKPVTIADLPPRYRPLDWQPEPEELFVAPPIPPVAVSLRDDFEDQDDSRVTLSEREALYLLEPELRPVAIDLSVLPESGVDLRLHIATIEESLIRQALERSGGVVAQAARLLGLRRTTLVEKLRKFGLNVLDEATED